MTDLTDLIARVEAGEGSDGDLFYEAWNSLAQSDHQFRRLACSTIDAIGTTQAGRFASLVDVGAYLEAVTALVPEGIAFTVGQNVHHRYWQASVNALNDDGEPFSLGCSNATTSPARALLAAILRAKAGGA